MNSVYYSPVIKSFENKRQYEDFLRKESVLTVVDNYKEILFEKFINSDPKHYFSSALLQKKAFQLFSEDILSLRKNIYNTGIWVYHPWDKTLFHLIDKSAYMQLRTIRNRNIISLSQQEELYNTTIALAGLSVGKNILLSLVRYGIGSHYRIADNDTVAVSNFNRSLYSLYDLGKSKCETAIKDTHAIDPFITISAFEHGITDGAIEEFVDGASVIIGAFDNFPLNLTLRKLARKKKIPIISGFDVEKGTLLIVERYDIEDVDEKVFLNSYTKDAILSATSLEQKTEAFINIIGKEYHSKLMLESVLTVGKKLTGYPQIIIATLLTASIFTLVAEEILLGSDIKSFRKFIPLDSLVF